MLTYLKLLRPIAPRLELRSIESTLVLSRVTLALVSIAALASIAMPIPEGVGVAVVTGYALFLLGYLADRGKRAREESALVKRVVTRAYSQPGVRWLLRTAFDELSTLFGADVVFIAARDRRRGRSYVWRFGRTVAGAEPDVHFLRIDKEQEPGFFFAPVGQAWLLKFDSGRIASRDVVREDDDPLPPPTMPAPVVMALTTQSVVAITTPLWDRWEAATIVVDSRAAVTPEQLRLARIIVRELHAPALNAFELSRLRGRVAAAQRKRFARDLHDGLLQSLIGLELKTHALRERILQRDPDTAAGLGQIQRALRKETAEARRLTQQLRAAVVEPHELTGDMGAAVMKFRHDTSIAATFDADEQCGAVSSRVAAELMRILQEALANVRRHSRAQSVAVRLSHADGMWRLVIEDDGAGFDFSGRRTLDDLTDARTGPATIMERVRLLNGQLFVDSFPTRGARLEVVVPAGGRS